MGLKQNDLRERMRKLQNPARGEGSFERMRADLEKERRNNEAARHLIAEIIRDRDHLLLENEQLYHEKLQAEKDARIDALTGLPNLRSYQETITREIENAKRYGPPLTLMMIDIDNFKKINTVQGNDIGDLAIKRMSHLISQNLRIGDTIARIGGDEFIIILPNTRLEDARGVAEKLVGVVEKGSATELTPGFTISGGYAQFNEKSGNAHILRENADKALHESKLKGKNQMLPFEEGRKIEKSELIAQAIQHINRSMPKGLSKEDRQLIVKGLSEAIEKEDGE